LKIRRSLSTAYHPETDGQTERMNQTMEQYLRIYVDDQQIIWVSLLPLASFTYNATTQNTTKMSPFFANFGREPQYDIESGNILPTDAVATASEMLDIHQQLKKDIQFLNVRMAAYANKSRTKGPVLKKGDKVYLWRRNIKTKRPSNKLDYRKLGTFRISEVKGPVNYKLELPKGMRIHPVFHVSLLEPADPEAPLDYTTVLQDDQQNPEYDVETVVDHTVVGRQHKYLIKWQNYPPEENTWEPMSHLKKVHQKLWEFHQKNPSHSSPPALNHRRSQGKKKGRR